MDEAVWRVDEFHEGREGLRPIGRAQGDDETVDDRSRRISNHRDWVPNHRKDVGLDVLYHVAGEGLEAHADVGLEEQPRH